MKHTDTTAPPLKTSVAVHKALAHPVRLRVLAMLEGGELCVCQMTAVLDLAPSTVSAHLADLRRAGLVAERKDGRWVSYRWPDSAVRRRELRRIVAGVREDSRVQEDARLLRRLRQVPVEELCRLDLDVGRLGMRSRFSVDRIGRLPKGTPTQP